MHILFYEQAVFERGTKMEEKAYLRLTDNKFNGKAILVLLYHGRVQTHLYCSKNSDQKVSG